MWGQSQRKVDAILTSLYLYSLLDSLSVSGHGRCGLRVILWWPLCPDTTYNKNLDLSLHKQTLIHCVPATRPTPDRATATTSQGT